MAKYLTESYDYLVDHGGRRSEGVVGDHRGSEKLYLHVVEVSDAEIGQLTARVDENGNKQHDRLALPRNEEWWVAVDGEARWPKIGGYKLVSCCAVDGTGIPTPRPLSEDDLARLAQEGVPL